MEGAIDTDEPVQALARLDRLGPITAAALARALETDFTPAEQRQLAAAVPLLDRLAQTI